MNASEAYELYRAGKITRREWSDIMMAEVFGAGMTVEHTSRYVTAVDTLEEAWAFVMDRLDSVGAPPTIVIKPHWLPADDPDDHPYYFEVTVEGQETLDNTANGD